MSLTAMKVRTRVPRIFVAEDEPGILELVVTHLERAGCEVRYAKDGWRALEGIQGNRPDGVLLDINMGGMDGFAVLRALRAHAATAHIPVLMMTARGAPADVALAIELGARDYLTKPFEDHELLQRVARLVRRRAPSEPGPEGPDDVLML